MEPTPRTTRRVVLAAITIVIATILTFPAVGTAAALRDGGCVAATAAAKKKPCSECRPSLKGSAFGDTDPAAGDVGTTAGQEAILQVKLRGCRLPKGARMVIIRQEIDSLGNDLGKSVRLRCGRSSCRLPQTRASGGGYRYQVAIVRCKGARRSKVVTVVWAPRSTTPAPAPAPPPNPTPKAKPTMKFNAVSYFQAPSEPACIAPLPGGAGASSASYQEPQGKFKHAWKWSVPAEITSGAGASLEAATSSPNQGGTSTTISIRTPSEFGISPTNGDVDAVVPVGQAGSDQDSRAYTFTPRRDFVVGEKLYIVIGFSCAAFAYEYIGA